MTSPLKRLFGQTAMYGMPSILGRMLNYLLVPLYTDVFAKTADYGVLSDLYAYVAFFVVLLTFGMETAYFRFIQNSDDKEHVFRNSLLPIVFINILFYLLLFVGNSTIASWMLYEDHSEFIMMIGGIVCIDAIASLPLAKLRAENQSKRFVWIQMSSILLNILLNLIFLLGFFDPSRPEEGILFILIANILSSSLKLILVSDIIRTISFQFDFKLMKQMLFYSFPLVIAGFAGIINETLDRILLKQILYDPNVADSLEKATSQVGIYSACYKLAMLVTILLQAYRYAAEPFFFAQMKNQDRNVVFVKVMNVFVAVVCLAFLFVSMNLGLFKFFIRKEAYWVGLKVVPILLFANVCLGIYYNQSVWYKISNNTKYGAYISLVGASITILINLAFIPMYGYMASAWATFFAYFIQMVLSYYWGQKKNPIPYDTRKFFIYIGGAIAIYSVFSLVRQSMSVSIKDFNPLLFFMGNGMAVAYLVYVYLNERTVISKPIR